MCDEQAVVEAYAQRLAETISADSEALRWEQARMVAADVVRQRAASLRENGNPVDWLALSKSLLREMP